MVLIMYGVVFAPTNHHMMLLVVVVLSEVSAVRKCTVYCSHQLTITFCCSYNDYVYDYFFLCYHFVEMPGRKKLIGVRKVKKDEKAKDSIRLISSLECLPQICKGFSKDSVECKCLSDLLERHRSNINEVKMYFSNLSTEMWSQEEQGSDLLGIC